MGKSFDRENREGIVVLKEADKRKMGSKSNRPLPTHRIVK